MKAKKQNIDPDYNLLLEKIGEFLENTGYSDDPRIIPRLKNTASFHKLRKKMYSGGLPPTMAGIGEKFNSIVKNYDLIRMGFWSVYPVFFAVITLDQVREKTFPSVVKNYNRDLYHFFEYCTKCTFRVTIWPKVQIHSYPKGYLAIVMDEKTSADGLINTWKNEWARIQEFDKFYILPPIIINMKEKSIQIPFSKTRLTKYPPSIKDFKKAIF